MAAIYGKWIAPCQGGSIARQEKCDTCSENQNRGACGMGRQVSKKSEAQRLRECSWRAIRGPWGASIARADAFPGEEASGPSDPSDWLLAEQARFGLASPGLHQCICCALHAFMDGIEVRLNGNLSGGRRLVAE
jgi:hypothetical protein